jgi:hypothetical protein
MQPRAAGKTLGGQQDSKSQSSQVEPLVALNNISNLSSSLSDDNMQSSALLQVGILAVLPILCQHSLSDSQTVCRMLSVSKGWTTTLKQCQPWVAIGLCLKRESDLDKCAGLAHWLESYACMVKELQVTNFADNPFVIRTAHQLLGSSLKLAALNGKPAGLQSVNLDNLPGRKLLLSLPAASLTSLQLFNIDPGDPSTSQLALGIGQLTNLRTCSLWFVDADPGTAAAAATLPSACLSTLSALTRLSSLDLSTGGRSLEPLPQLPSQLQSLSVNIRGKFVMDALSLTRLTSLSLTDRDGIAKGSQLPPSLTSVSLQNTPLYPSNIRMLSNVCKLSIEADIQLSHATLAELSSLAQLDSISMSVLNPKAAAAASAAWKQLPHLQDLEIDLVEHDEDQDGRGYRLLNVVRAEERARAVLQGLAAATQLTWLSLTLDWNNSQCGSALAQLTNLQELILTGAGEVREDMMQLRALTQLKILRLEECGMDGTAAAALLCRLTGLQLLKLSTCENVTDAMVPVIGAQLRGLRRLELFNLPGFSDDSVQSLVELTQLESLWLRELGLTREGALQLKAAAPFCIKVLDT